MQKATCVGGDGSVVRTLVFVNNNTGRPKKTDPGILGIFSESFHPFLKCFRLLNSS